MLRPRLLPALFLAGCAAAAAPSPSTPSTQTPTHAPAAPAPSKHIPWEGEALKEFDWEQLSPNAPEDRSDQFITVAVPNAPTTWDPHKAWDDVDKLVARSLFEGLVTRHPETCQPIPAIAEWWDVSPDRKVYTFHLRPDTRWSDGTSITAADVKWSLARALDEATGSAGRDLLGSMLPVAAAAGLKGGEAGAESPATELEVVSERTLRITLAQPEPRFIHALAEPAGVVVHRATVEAHGKKAFDAEHLAASGAFTRARGAASKGGATVLARNPNHWMQARVALSSVVLTWPSKYADALLPLFERGAVDWVPWPHRVGDRSRAVREAHYQAPGTAVQFLLFNCRAGDRACADPVVRLALSKAAYREHVAQELDGWEQPAGTLCPPGLPGYRTADPVSRRAPRGADLLADAGYGDGFTATLTILDTPEHRTIATTLIKTWERVLNARIVVQQLDYAGFREQLTGGWFDMAVVGHHEPLPHPAGYWRSPWLQTHGGSDAIMESALATAPGLEPIETMRRHTIAEHRLIHDLVAVAPLTRTHWHGLLNPRIQGLTPNVLNEHRLRYLRVVRDE